MRDSILISIVLLLIHFSGKTLGSKLCTTIRNEFVEDYLKFERCVLQNGVPATFCTKCITFYVIQLQSLKKLMSTIDPDAGNQFCSNEFIAINRLDVLQRGVDNAHEIWQNAGCDYCFNCIPEKVPINANISVECQQPANVKKTFDYINMVQECFVQSTRQEDVCQTCMANYTNLMKVFESLKSTSHGICFDINDAINRTQIIWTKQFHCSNDASTSDWGFFSILFVLIASVGCSYGVSVYYRNYKLRNSYLQTAINNDNAARGLNTFEDRISNSDSL